VFFDFTIRKLFQIAELPEPKAFKDLLDQPITEISTSNKWKKVGAPGLRVMVGFTFERVSIDTYLKMIDEGVIVISYKQIYDKDNRPVKMILLSNFDEMAKLWSSIGRYISEFFSLPTIAITGSVGKTTVTSLIENIFKEKYKVFSTSGNLNNTEYIVREMVRYFDETYSIHIQEIGGGVPGSVERVAGMLKPDIFVITNILPHHLTRYKLFENIVKDKTSLDKYTNKQGCGVINIDDNALADHQYTHNVITCGITHLDADYVGKNIRQEGTWLKLDVCFNGNAVPVEVNIPGKHNAINILLAFATAKEYGIDTSTICKGLKKYRSDLIRQNIMNLSGRIFYVDCFNHSVDSMRAALNFMQEYEITSANRKIAVLGGENDLGDKEFSVNYEFGLTLENYDSIDEFIFFGPSINATAKDKNRIGDAFAVFQGAQRVLRFRKISYYSDREALAEKLFMDTKPGDLILLKGVVHKPLWPVIDIAFGSGLTMRSGVVPVTHKVSDEESTGVYYEYVKGVNVLDARINQGLLSIPNTIGEKPVFRVGREAFKNNASISSIDFGNSLVNIGVKSFEGCEKIMDLKIPPNVLHIEREAFAEIKNLTHIVMDGVEHIASRAFADCKALQIVELTQRCLFIAEDAFENCGDFVLISDSEYVKKWAEKHHISHHDALRILERK